MTSTAIPTKSFHLKALALTGLIIYLHLFLEWLFFLTSPTYFANLEISEKYFTLFIPPFIFFLALAPVQVIIQELAGPRKYFPVRLFVPALLLTCSASLLIDNFTYIIFKFGTPSIRSEWRFIYGLLFILLFLSVFRFLNRHLAFMTKKTLNYLFVLISLLIGVSVAATIQSILTTSNQTLSPPKNFDRSKLSDVLILSGESLQADMLPVYGNSSVRTPFLSGFKNEAVIYENAYTNINRTSGSLASILSGKHGTTTHKLHSGHIFKGRDCYEHLPGILKTVGYHNIQLGWRHHADAFHWNMRRAFDVINTRKPLFSFDILGGRLALEMQFLGFATDRVWDRLQHIFGGELVPTKPLYLANLQLIGDREKIDRLMAFMKDHPGPIFVHIHFDWITSKSSAAHFDEFLKSIADALKMRGTYDQCLIVILGDHGRGYKIDKRLPLIIKYPKGVHPADTKANVQNLDIAPTILDSLHLPVPSWMEGQSLLKPREETRKIIGITTYNSGHGLPLAGRPSTRKGGPQAINVTICQKTYRLDLNSGNFKSYLIDGATGICPDKMLPADPDVRRDMVDHLAKRGYDVKKLERKKS